LDNPKLIESFLAKFSPDKTLCALRDELKDAETKRRKVNAKVGNLLNVQAESPMIKSAFDEKIAECERTAKDLDEQVARINNQIVALVNSGHTSKDLWHNVSVIRDGIQGGSLTLTEKREACLALRVRVTAWKRASKVEMLAPTS
jgi:hypothetical protein